MSSDAWIIGAIRTPVATENGKLSEYSAWKLGELASNALIDSLRLDRTDIDLCVLGNALYGGGNPTRLAALGSNIPIQVPAITLDTQCCSGVDAIGYAASQIKSGSCDVVIAGGAESHTTAPRRLKRFRDGRPDAEYSRPPFSPWSDKDPDLLVAAADLASQMNITRSEQEDYAVRSHELAQAASAHLKSASMQLNNELVTSLPLDTDTFTRKLTLKACTKLPIIAGDSTHGISAATTAVKADAAALCAVVSTGFLETHPQYRSGALKVLGVRSVGNDPSRPALAPIPAIKKVLESADLKVTEIGTFELMEAFASQAIACIRLCDIDPRRVNLGGGALARGHPIGASGAVNAVRLYHEMIRNEEQKYGLVTIAGAGGLGSAMVLSR